MTALPIYYTVEEVAAALRVDRRTVVAMIRRGELSGALRVGAQYRIPAAAFSIPL